jgi:hypothetical protein
MTTTVITGAILSRFPLTHAAGADGNSGNRHYQTRKGGLRSKTKVRSDKRRNKFEAQNAIERKGTDS